MTRGELAEFLSKKAKALAPTIIESCIRNGHMNEASAIDLNKTPQEVSDAIIVAFVNEVMSSQGIDLALYARDLK